MADICSEPHLVPFGSYYQGRRLLVTGDTGFKGTWLCEWLCSLGAEVHGIGLEPDTEPSIFETTRLRNRVEHRTLDIRDSDSVHHYVNELRPDIVFHLAAQSLVRRSYSKPLETLETNVMGTAHLLSAVNQTRRDDGSPIPVVVVTSDKCYENPETGRAFEEDDPKGGSDIYSASKGAAELVATAWRRSFANSHGASLATCRAGNVVGGGDWAEDRIVPDCIRALRSGETIVVRNPDSVRPWQHVLEPLSGYLLVGSLLESRREVNGAWNFGPSLDSARTVSQLVEALIEEWGEGSWVVAERQDGLAEAVLLHLSIKKAQSSLAWSPVWDFRQTLRATASWYREVGPHTSADTAAGYTRDQIRQYQLAAATTGLEWAR